MALQTITDVESKTYCSNCDDIAVLERVYEQAVHFYRCTNCGNETNDPECLSGVDGCPNDCV